MIKKNTKVICIISIALLILFNLVTKVEAHSVELDPKSLISMPWIISNGSGTVTIKNSVTDYTLYFQAVEIESSKYSQIKKINSDGDAELKKIKEEYTAMKAEVNNLKEVYDTASNAYTEGLKNTDLSDEEKQKLKASYETAKNNYQSKITEYNTKIDEYNNKAKEINSQIKALTPMYNENNWTKAIDNKISIDITKFSGEKSYTIWVKLVTADGTYYDESIYTMEGTKATEVNVTGITLDKTSISLTKDSKYTLTVTVTPSNATDKNITWKSDDENVATVSNGEITAKGVGSTTITATSNDGNYIATCKVTVTEKTIKKDDEPKTDNTEVKKDEDNTVAQGKLPYAGVSSMIIGVIIAIGILGIVFYKKYRYFNIK